jgi:FtsH-binding integral membrane protein
MSDKTNFADVIRKNRLIMLAILMLPVIGMVIAIPLILWRVPGAARVAIPIIFVLMVQYTLLVVWISRKMRQVTES